MVSPLMFLEFIAQMIAAGRYGKFNQALGGTERRARKAATALTSLDASLARIDGSVAGRLTKAGLIAQSDPPSDGRRG